MRAAPAADFTPTPAGTTRSRLLRGRRRPRGKQGRGAVNGRRPNHDEPELRPTTVQIDSSAACTATLTDKRRRRRPSRQSARLNFSSSPTAARSGPPGACHWDPSSAGTGEARRAMSRSLPPSPGGYTLTAEYGGDSTHGKSTGTFRVTATTTPAGGGPGSHGGGGGTVTVVISAGPPPPGRVTIASSAKVSRRHAGALALSCAGASGSTLHRRADVHQAGEGQGQGPGQEQAPLEEGQEGSQDQDQDRDEVHDGRRRVADLQPGDARSQAVTFKLSPAAIKLLAKARGGRLEGAGVVGRLSRQDRHPAGAQAQEA